MRLLPKSIHWCRRYPTKFNSGRDIPRRNDRIIKVERRALHGAAWRFDDALNNSEDSSTLNTSFIERLNLTIRQSSAYL